jgi:hypothetical protein
LNLARDLNNDFFIEEITFIIIFKIGLSFIDTRCKLKITFLSGWQRSCHCRRDRRQRRIQV